MSLDPNYNIKSYFRAAKLIHDPRSPLGFYGGKGVTFNAPTQQVWFEIVYFYVFFLCLIIYFMVSGPSGPADPASVTLERTGTQNVSCLARPTKLYL